MIASSLPRVSSIAKAARYVATEEQPLSPQTKSKSERSECLQKMKISWRFLCQEIKNSDSVLPVLQAAPRAGCAEFRKGMLICGEGRNVANLIKVWRLARDKDIKLTRTTYSALIAACGKAVRGQNQEIKSIGLEAGKRAWQWMVSDRYQPDTTAFAVAMSLCAQAGDVAWATKLWGDTPEPNSIIWNRYLETLALHSSPDAWETVKKEVSDRLADESRFSPNARTLSSLLNASALHNDIHFADWCWDSLAAKVEVDAIVYSARSKSLLLGLRHEHVPELRCEMSHRQIKPLFRNLLHEVQAWLLLLYERPDERHYAGFQQACQACREACQVADAARVDMGQLRRMQRLGESIWTGKCAAALSDVRVMAWPWPPWPAEPHETKRPTRTTKVPIATA
mmetsp:Transcript_2884/g.6907  ORF Transcript_2884/g.6907 Transcript_2884/m.6907 type:complete len:396 (-) Transcript_2884:8-1195(-)